MSADYKWPASTLCPPGYTHCVRLLSGTFYWARKVRRHPLCGTKSEYIGRGVNTLNAMDHPISQTQVAAAVHYHSSAVGYGAQAVQLYSAVGVSPVGMFWVKQQTGPIETLRAPYDEILELVKKLAEKYPDTTYTVVKVCAEVRTPPKPTLEVKEY